jgi:hypothetical protein
MMNFRVKVPVVCSVAVLSVACLGSFGFFNEAKAICNDKCFAGFTACLAWCDAHNKTTKSQGQCAARCDRYWGSGKNPQSISVPPHPSNPSGPPDKGVGPGKLKNPPTTVSNPNAPTQPPFQIRDRGRK